MLTTKQVKQLEDKDWKVKPFGCYLTLYREEYSDLGWVEICKIVGSDAESKHVTVLIFGHNDK